MTGAGVSLSGVAAGGSVDEGHVGRGQVQAFSAGSSDDSGNAFVVLYGRLGAGVTAVAFQLSNGIAVHATVSHRWYLAWWPNRAHATAALITTASGSRTVALSGAAAAGAPSCGGAGTGCGGVGPPVNIG
jgi:hypothetical protein